MRPLELAIEGFKSYRRAQKFSFESRGLFGIVGPTGSGKSSILEALMFALYGKTPRVERDTKKLINSQEDQARIQLLFEVDEVVWEVIRVIRRTAPSQAVLRKPSGSDLVSGERNVNERIAQIIGLDFGAFCASVSLPQGEFDRFLKATPTERSRILKGIFRLDRVDLLREAARTRWSSIEAQMAGLQAALDSLPADPQALLDVLTAKLEEARTRLGTLAEELPAVTQAEQEVQRSGEQVARLFQEMEQTQAALNRLPDQDTLKQLGDRIEGSRRRLQEAEGRLRQASGMLARAEHDAAMAMEQTGGEAWITQVKGRMEQQARLVEKLESVRQQLACHEEAVAAKSAEVESMTSALREAEARFECGRSFMSRLQQEHAAHVLRLELKAGETCPVCDQPVTRLPEVHELPALSQAEERLSDCEADLADARLAREEATGGLALAQERLRLTAGVLAEAEGDFARVCSALSELFGDCDDPPAELSRRESALAGALAAAREARRARDLADGQERVARQRLAEASEGTRTVADLLIHTCGLLGMGSFSSELELGLAAKGVAEYAFERLEMLKGKIAGLRRACSEAAQLVEEFRRRFGLEAGERVSDVLAGAKAEVLGLESKIDEERAQMARRSEIELLLGNLAERKGRYARVIADFTDSRFTAFLLDEQRRLLSRIGSEKLLELTGRYCFDEEGLFRVIDQATGTTRTADTLSGGETFLASLSLALALSEAVSLEGGRLGCFFLDEGFGSLDAESLDLALEGIEALAVPGKLIGLISHVGGIQSRLDDLIVLERCGDGSTDVAQHEGPIGYLPGLI